VVGIALPASAVADQDAWRRFYMRVRNESSAAYGVHAGMQQRGSHETGQHRRVGMWGLDQVGPSHTKAVRAEVNRTHSSVSDSPRIRPLLHAAHETIRTPLHGAYQLLWCASA